MLFGSEDHQAIHKGILQIINDDALREKMIEDGYKNSANYQPIKIGKLYEQFYKHIFNLD